MVDLVGIGTVLGGLGGIFGRKKGPGPGAQAYQQLKGAFKAADEAGLHRLAVAGSPAGYTPAPATGGEGLLAVGQTLRDLGDHRANRRIEAKQADLIDAQIEEARSRTALNEANARRSFSGPQPGLGGFQTRLQRAISAMDASRHGERSVRVEPQPDLPARQEVSLGDSTAVGPNPEAFEVGLSELIAGGLIYGPQWLADRLVTRPVERRGTTKPRPPRRDRHGYVISPRAGTGG